MRNRFRILAGLTPVLVLTSTILADTLEDVEKKIIEKNKSLTGMECRVLSKQDMTAPAKMKGEQDSTMKSMKNKDGKWLSRVESKSKMEIDMGGQSQKTDSTMLMVNDEKFSYMLSETAGQKSAMKTVAQGASMVIDESSWKALHENYNLKLLADDSVSGKSCWVIEMTPKQAQPGVATTSTWYEKDTCVALKVISKDEAGKVVSEVTISDIKLNQSYPPETFTFKCPEGVQMQDMTQAMAQPTETAQPAAEAKEEKKEEPAKEEPKAEKKEEKKDKKIKLPKLP